MNENDTRSVALATAPSEAPNVARSDVHDAAGADANDETLRFDDAYWDDAFCAWWDPALRTCCG